MTVLYDLSTIATHVGCCLCCLEPDYKTFCKNADSVVVNGRLCKSPDMHVYVIPYGIEGAAFRIEVARSGCSIDNQRHCL